MGAILDVANFVSTPLGAIFAIAAVTLFYDCFLFLREVGHHRLRTTKPLAESAPELRAGSLSRPGSI
jgi:hypothetical protein